MWSLNELVGLGRRVVGWNVHIVGLSLVALASCGAPASENPGFVTGALCNGIQVSFSPTGPSPAGASIVFSASAACAAGETPQFRFSYRREATGSAWTEFRGWSTTTTATWNTASPTALPTGHYRFSIEARPVGSTSQSTRSDVYYSLGGNCDSGAGTPGDDAFCTSCVCTTGQGDCDGHDCAAGLVCGNDQGPKFGFSANTDVCVPQHCTNNLQDSAAGETGLDCGGPCGNCLTACAGTPGGNDFCVACACASGQGDCDGDSECAAGLTCGKANGNQFGFGAGTDACVPPHCQNNVQDASLGEAGIDCGGVCGECLPPCSGTASGKDACVGCRCAAGQGDCDGNSECARGLTCGSNNGPEFGLPEGWDVCIGSGAGDVVPEFECVETRTDGSQVALFGYFNPNTTPITLSIGTQNSFSPGAANRRQPTTFLPGHHRRAVAVTLAASALSWTLEGTQATVNTDSACPGNAQLTTFADTRVSATSAAANFGTATTLAVSADSVAIVGFDRDAILAARGAASFITNARLEVSLVSGSAALDAYPMKRAWTESGATWNCANDQNASNTAETCHNAQRWSFQHAPGSLDNPYDADAAVAGNSSGAVIAFDVTEQVQAALLEGRSGDALSWALKPQATSVLGSREGGAAARLVITALSLGEGDLGTSVPFSFDVNTALATTDQLPAFADGVPRPLAVLETSDGDALRFAQNELLVMTDDPVELAAIIARWNATEVAVAPVTIPGIPLGHVLRISASTADTSVLAPYLRQLIGRPDGAQNVSSDAGLRLLAAAAAEHARGTLVGINWVSPGAALTIEALGNNLTVDGAPVASAAATEGSSNAYAWDSFGSTMHRVTSAWELMFFTGKMKRSVDVAIIDAGFSNPFQDHPKYTQTFCASGSCKNPFDCGGGSACPWHGVHVANAGFAEPNNGRGAAGPGAEVSDLTLYWGFGDMATLLLSIPLLVAGGEDIINISAAIPVPDYLFFTTVPAELVLKAARRVSGRMIVAAAGNANTNVDKKRCYNVFVGEICPWEEKTWFPCEADGVICVGATNYADKSRASYSNRGHSVRLYATGTTLATGDPDTDIGTGFQIKTGTSYAAPFLAGIAALTWAADKDQSVGDVEACLSSARNGGPDGRFVDAFWAVSCALGSPSNVPPFVQITTPATETTHFDSIGPISLVAQAADFESGTVNTITWTSNVEGLIGTTVPGASLFYQPSGPGLRTITARAFDPLNSSLVGSDTAVLSFAPAPPHVEILAPAAGEDVPLNLPVELLAHVTNLTRFPAVQPCSASFWSGFSGSTPVFSNVPGCAALGSYTTLGASSAHVAMTVDGLTGTATRNFNVVSDGKFRVVITSPLRGPNLMANLPHQQAQTLSAASTADSTGGVSYTWRLTRVHPNGVLDTNSTILAGQSVTYTPSFTETCISPRVQLEVFASDQLGQMANARVLAEVFDLPCKPE